MLDLHGMHLCALRRRWSIRRLLRQELRSKASEVTDLDAASRRFKDIDVGVLICFNVFYRLLRLSGAMRLRSLRRRSWRSKR